MRTRLWLLAGVAVLASVPLFVRAGRPRPWAEVVPAMVKVRPGQRHQGSAEIRLSAARGECEAAQVVASAPVRGVRPTASDLRHGDSKPIVPRLAREAWLEIGEPSNSEGREGLWPDPLIPARDLYVGEARNAFPASSDGPAPVVVHYEVCVPASATPGTWRGTLAVAAEGRQTMRFPVVLEVRRFALPATSSLPTTFGFSGLTACHGHALDSEGGCVRDLTRLYALAALRHRISLHGMTMEPPPFAPGRTDALDFRDYDAEVGPFLDGQALPEGARFTTIDVRTHPAAKTDAQLVSYWRAYARHLRARGWLDRAFIYAKDEPRPEDLPEVVRLARLAHQADPALRVLVTSSLAAPLTGAMDILAPNINCLFGRGFTGYCGGTIVPMEAYRGERNRGARLWWYQSCGSHGCGPIPAKELQARAYFRGWPSYMVDHDGALNRAMGPLAFRFGVEGELYFNTVQAYLPPEPSTSPSGTKRGAALTSSDPWESLWRFHGNGDGTLFYPGTPSRIGGTSHIPIESLRLKHLRDGLEDYEYLELARGLGLRAEAEAFVAKLTPRPFDIRRDEKAWAQARERLAAAIEEAVARQPEYPIQPAVQGKGR